MGSVLNCPSCKRKFTLKPELAGKRVRCKCGQIISIPKAEEVAAEEDATELDAFAALETQGDVAVAAPPPYKAAKSRRPKEPRVASDDIPWALAIWRAIVSREPAASRRQHLAQFWIFSTFLIGFGIVALGFSYTKDQEHNRFMARAPKTRGVVGHDPTVKQEGRGAGKLNNDNWIYSFPIGFTVEGQNYTKDISVRGDSLPNDLSRDDTTHWMGKPVEVYYDTANPNRAEIASYATGNNWFWGYIVGGVFLVVGLFASIRSWPYGGR